MSVNEGKSVAERVRIFSGEQPAGSQDSNNRGSTGSTAGEIGKQLKAVRTRSSNKRGKGGKEDANDDKGRPRMNETDAESQDGKCDDDEYPCDNCKSVGMSDHLIQCECCDRWLCCTCQNIPNAMAKSILRWKQLHWFCLDCEDAATKAVKAPSRNKIISDVAVETASLIISIVQAEMSKETYKMTTSYAKVVKDMSTISNPAFKQSNATTPSSDKDAGNLAKPQQVVESIDEYLDREKRRMNLIIHNLPESTAPSPTEKSQQDQEKFSRILKDEFHLSGVAVEKCVRLGKPTNNRPRLLLVALHDFQQKRDILRNAKQLQNSNEWGNIYISPDLTPKERDIGKKLRLELKARRDNGETNLVIRRGQIITMNLLPNVGNQQQAQRNTIPNSDKPADTTPQVPQPPGSSGIED